MLTLSGTGRVIAEPRVETEGDKPRISVIVGSSVNVSMKKDDGSWGYGYQNTSVRVTIFGNYATALLRAGIKQGVNVAFTGTPANPNFYKGNDGTDRLSIDLQNSNLELIRESSFNGESGAKDRLDQAIKKGVVTKGFKGRATIPAKKPKKDADLEELETEEEDWDSEA